MSKEDMDGKREEKRRKDKKSPAISIVIGGSKGS